MTPVLYGQAVWQYCKKSTPAKKREALAALKDVEENGVWHEVPFPYLPGTVAAQSGTFVFTAKREPGGNLLISAISEPPPMFPDNMM